MKKRGGGRAGAEIWGKARSPGPHVSRGPPEAVNSGPPPPEAGCTRTIESGEWMMMGGGRITPLSGELLGAGMMRRKEGARGGARGRRPRKMHHERVYLFAWWKPRKWSGLPVQNVPEAESARVNPEVQEGRRRREAHRRTPHSSSSSRAAPTKPSTPCVPTNAGAAPAAAAAAPKRRKQRAEPAAAAGPGELPERAKKRDADEAAPRDWLAAPARPSSSSPKAHHGLATGQEEAHGSGGRAGARSGRGGPRILRRRLQLERTRGFGGSTTRLDRGAGRRRGTNGAERQVRARPEAAHPHRASTSACVAARPGGRSILRRRARVSYAARESNRPRGPTAV